MKHVCGRLAALAFPLALGLSAVTACSSDSDGDNYGSGGGGGSGGTSSALSCDAYCTTVMANCTAANSQYADTAACKSACAPWPAGTASDQSGATLGCHTYHAGAAKSDPGIHCAHAGPTGGGICI